MLNADLQAERTARPMYQEAIAYCESVKDYISRELFENILDSEEDHINDLEGGTAELNAINVKPNQAANPPGRPALASPIPMPTLLLAGPGVNWQTATRSA